MIEGMNVTDVLRESVYGPAEHRDTYFSSLSFLQKHVSEAAVKEHAEHNPSRAHSAFGDLLPWAVDESYPAFAQPTEARPTLRLAYAKYAVANDYLPVNFHQWALAILEWLDLRRYREAHKISKGEYEAMATDLKSVLAKLKAYPTCNFVATMAGGLVGPWLALCQSWYDLCDGNPRKEDAVTSPSRGYEFSFRRYRQAGAKGCRTTDEKIGQKSAESQTGMAVTLPAELGA